MSDSATGFTLATATGAIWLALMGHFGAGLAGLVSGCLSLAVRKGGPWHRRSGVVFVLSMVVLGLTASGIAAAEGNIGSVLGGGMTVYFVITAFTTLRPAGASYRHASAITLTVAALGISLTQLYYAQVAMGQPGMLLNGVPGPMILLLGTVTLLAAIGDIRLFRKGSIIGTRRVARHLWRMSFALFIASGSFFFGQLDFLPAVLRFGPVVTLLGVGPLLALVYWMWRVRVRHRLQGLVLGGAGLLLSTGCTGTNEALEGPLRVRALADVGDTLRRVVEGVPTGERLVRLTPEIAISALDTAGNEPLSRVRSVIGLRDGSAMVYDESYGRIVLFDPSGRSVRQVGRAGGGPGEYGAPYGMTALPDDRVVLWDGGNARLNIYQPDGAFARMWPVMSTGLSTADGITSDTTGVLYLRAMLRFDPAVPGNSIVGLVRWDSLGARDSIPFPRWNAPAPALLARMPNGMTVSGGSVPYLPRDHHRITATGVLVTGPGEPYDFVLLGRGGVRPVRISRAYLPVPIAPEEQSSIRSRIEGDMRLVDPAWSWDGPALPTNKPAYRGIDVDREGRIWILLSTPTLDEPQRETPVYDVYTPDGAPIARVELPRGGRFVSATRTHLWTVRLDSLDVPVVERARLELPAPLR